jgi:hypothetical protein
MLILSGIEKKEKHLSLSWKDFLKRKRRIKDL